MHKARTMSGSWQKTSRRRDGRAGSDHRCTRHEQGATSGIARAGSDRWCTRHEQGVAPGKRLLGRGVGPEELEVIAGA